VIADWNLTQEEAGAAPKRGPRHGGGQPPPATASASLLANAPNVTAAPGAAEFWLNTGALSVT
jgi:hypothetical protein